MDKTIVVKVDTIKAHRRYKKVVRRSTKFHAHDERNEALVKIWQDATEEVGNVAAFLLFPSGPDRTTIVNEFLFHPAEMTRPGFDPAAWAAVVDRAREERLTLRQLFDVAMCGFWSLGGFAGGADDVGARHGDRRRQHRHRRNDRADAACPRCWGGRGSDRAARGRAPGGRPPRQLQRRLPLLGRRLGGPRRAESADDPRLPSEWARRSRGPDHPARCCWHP